MKSKMNALFVALLIFASLFVMGCTQTKEDTNETPSPTQTVEEEETEPTPEEEIVIPEEEEMPIEPTPEEETELMYINDVYNYGSLSEYEYRVTSVAGGEESVTSFKYSIKSDELDGNDAWLQESIIDNEMANLKTKTWIDKASHQCLKVTTEFDVDGELIVSEGNCPEESTWGEGENAPALSYVGMEEVSIPLGTYNAQKYNLDVVSYWIEPTVPLPLKVTYEEANTVMELVSYS